MGYIARISSGLTAFGCAGFLIGAIMSNNGSQVVADTSNLNGALSKNELVGVEGNRIDTIITSALERVEQIEAGEDPSIIKPARRVKTVSITPKNVDELLKPTKKKLKIEKVAAKAPAAPEKKLAEGKIYTVKAGDNLYRIGLNHGLSLAKIAKLNGIGKPYNVRVGQKIRVQ